LYMRVCAGGGGGEPAADDKTHSLTSLLIFTCSVCQKRPTGRALFSLGGAAWKAKNIYCFSSQ
jgi:hypothetical protein